MAPSQLRARRSAIDVLVPELAALIDEWRVPTVAVAAAGVPPHITLLFPWRLAPVADSDVAAVAATIAHTRPFELTFAEFGRFPETLFLRPEPEAPIRALIRCLAEAFRDTPPYEGRFASPVPHLTVAKAADADLDRIEAEVRARLGPHLPIRLTVHALAILEEGPDGIWSTRREIPLVGRGRQSGPPGR